MMLIPNNIMIAVMAELMFETYQVPALCTGVDALLARAALPSPRAREECS